MNTNKPKKVRKVNEKTLIVAMDIGKYIHYGYFRTPDHKELGPFAFHNGGHSFEKFWKKICEFRNKHHLEEVVIGFESTGPYAEPIAGYLRKKEVTIVQVNPMHTKRVKELTGNSPNKTDKKDPRVIADVISLGHCLTVVVPEGPAAHLRRLTMARERSIASRTAMLNQMQDLAFILFPELLHIIRPSSKTGMYLLRNYSTPESILNAEFETLLCDIRKLSRGRYNQEHVYMLFKAAKNSVGIQDGKESIIFEMQHLISNIENENRYIDSLEEQMALHLVQIPYSRSILTIKGIGAVTVAGLIGEVGDFKKFNTISEVMKLAGLDLFEVSSGKHKGRHHISKRGRSLMRKLLFFAALNTIKSGGIMHAKYQKMIDNGTVKVKAVVAISRKLLRIIFALARDEVDYDANYNNEEQLKLAA